MACAAKNGHIEIIKLFKEWGQESLTQSCAMQLRMGISKLSEYTKNGAQSGGDVIACVRTNKHYNICFA